MEIVTLSTSDLKEYQNNPRDNAEAVDAVAESIKQFGFKVPIVIGKNNVIVCGHTRLKAAERLGLSSVPCIIADDLNDEQIKAYRLADNKVGELAEWDFEALEKELAELTAFDLDMSAFGFDESIFEDEFSTDFELPDDDKPQTRTITLSLCEEQYTIATACIDYVIANDLIAHDYGNNNKKSNALFEAVYEWAEQKNLS